MYLNRKVTEFFPTFATNCIFSHSTPHIFMTILDTINDFLWSYIVIVLLVFCAIYFTIRTKGVQFCNLRDMLKTVLEPATSNGRGDTEAGSDGTSANASQSSPSDKSPKPLSPFQAFAVSLSSRVGTGNLAGVASAIFVGGPGAVFWMWVMALFGSATAFVESTLAQLYKRRGEDSYYGGPAYYMQHGLHARWMGILFSVLITVTFGLANQIVQSTTLCDSISDTFSLSKAWVGIVVTVATLVIIFGGIQRISRFASLVVPFMAIGFIVLALGVMVMYCTELPKVFSLIFEGAFGVKSVAGGAVGAAVMQGVKRGLFSNEAGEGSAPNAAAIAETSHPVKQGLLQAFGVFVDTLIICSCTAFIILLSGKHDCGKDGILLTSEALTTIIGPFGGYFISAAIFLFAYSTIIANYFYGETNIRFITGKRWAVFLFRLLTGCVIMYGALVELQTAFSLVDIVMGLMTITNLVAIIILSPKVFHLLNDYLQQRRKGLDPVFHRSQMPEIEEDLECWE